MPLAAVTVLHAGTFAVAALVAMTWLPMGLFGAVVNFALSGNQALAVVFLVRVLGAGPFAAGLLLAVPGVSGLRSRAGDEVRVPRGRVTSQGRRVDGTTANATAATTTTADERLAGVDEG